MPKRVLILLGTRPEVIKLAPVVKEFQSRPAEFETIVCSTGQHREMLDQAMRVFQLKADLDLQLMAPNQTLAGLTSLLFKAIDKTIEDTKPDAIIVQGDTTSAFVGGMCGFYRRLIVGHVEAGLRTGNIWAPFPEEVNRAIVGRIATQHYAPTERSRQNLLREGIADTAINVTGNTVVDALHWMQRNNALNPTEEIPAHVVSGIAGKRMILVTSHRRESFGGGLDNTFRSIVHLANTFPDTVFVYPVHLNPNVQAPARAILADHPRIHLLPPVSYPALLWLMSKSFIILSDSGGIQEEAPSFSKPLLVLRDTTERPEAVDAGCAILVGTDEQKIISNATKLLSDPAAYAAMAGKPNPFGDGLASKRIGDMLTALPGS
jgi:UDP-N-acetylglucosamine 2-epimerase